MIFGKENLKEILNRPIDGTPLEICTEIQRRLQEAQLYEPILANLYDQHRRLLYDGDYSIPREMLYAVMAWALLRAKATIQEAYMDMRNCQVNPYVLHMECDRPHIREFQLNWWQQLCLKLSGIKIG